MAPQQGKPEQARITACVRQLVLISVALLLALNPWFSSRVQAQTVIATIPVGGGPIGVAVNHTTNLIYVASVFDGVTVIDGSTNAVVATLSGFSNPFLVAVDPTINRIYVTNSGNGTLSVLDGSTNTVVSTIPVGSDPHDVAVNDVTNRVYVANYASNTLSIIDQTTNTVMTTLSGFSHPNFVAVDPTTNRIYVTNAGSASLSVLDGSTNTVVSTIPVGTNPHGVVVNPATNRIYVANAGSGSVTLINQTTNTVVTTVSGLSGPVGIDVNIATNRIFVANNSNSTLSVLDGTTNTIVATVSIGASANGVGVNDATNRVYVANFASNSVSAIQDGQVATKMYWTDLGAAKIQRANPDGSGVEDLVTGPQSGAMALDLAGGKMYWTSGPQGKIQRANLNGSGVEDLITGLNGPHGIALDLAAGKMYYVIEGPQWAGSIGRANLDGSSPETLITGLGDARQIALDLIAGKMYWTDAGFDNIRRANLDGTDVEELVTGQTGPFGIALDLDARKMYWTDSSEGTIQRASLDGSDVEGLISGSGGPVGIALDLTAGKMYWADINVGKIQRANLNGSGVEDVVTGLSLPFGIALDMSIVVDTAPPVVNVSFSAPNGQNGWFVTSPVVGSVTADDTTTGGTDITAITCTGATVGSISGLGTPSASASLTVSAEGINNVNCTASDGAGNNGAAAGSNNTATVQTDTVAPIVTHNSGADSCSVPGNAGWCRGTQTAGFSASDATSGVANPCSGAACNFTQATTTNSSAVLIPSGAVADVAGNTNPGITAGPYQIDSVAPNILITAPANGATYLLNAAVASSYTCTDVTSGVATCTGPVASGVNFSTSTVGTNAFTVNATDIAGNPALATNTYSVLYTFSGFFQPIDNNLPNAAKASQTIPVKWRLTDANGIPIADPTSFVSLTSSATPGSCGGSADAIETYAGSSGLQYLGDGYWQFNWKTLKTYAGQCRTMSLNLRDGSSKTATFIFN